MSDELKPEALVDRDGLKVSKSPWGPDDEIGRLNWITTETVKAILERLDGSQGVRPGRRLLHRHAVLAAAGDPKYEIWMTHTPQGSIHDNLSGVGAEVHEKYSYCGDAIPMYTHCGTHIDTLNHLGYYGTFWNGWTADKDLGSRHLADGRRRKYPPIIARGVLLDIAGLHGVDCLPRRLRRHGRGAARRRPRSRASSCAESDVVCVRTGPDDEVARLRRLPARPARDRPRRAPSTSARRPARCASAATRSASR